MFQKPTGGSVKSPSSGRARSDQGVFEAATCIHMHCLIAVLQACLMTRFCELCLPLQLPLVINSSSSSFYDSM